ncbi:MAG: Bug family tripartite tricarboxylate transporter substrate binding protein [Pseudorhodoplanes sp.]|uniref:Bug family tripartite tricarboxylate transporter substrate binding protein n=1 Tax=Pseudorhodoplanes sp. TaxID=1934341 RepID=UPI003D0D82C0
MARIISEKLAQRLAQPVIVENKPGGGGTTAAAYVASQPADGYTILVGASGAMVIAPAVNTALQYETLRDFSPISLVASFPLVMIVSGEGPIKSVGDFVAWTKANPEKANYSTASATFTLSTELFKLRTGSKIQPIPYRGSSEAATSVIAGHTVTTIVDTLPAMPLIQAGKARALAITSAKRVPELPDVPTMQEAGVPNMELVIWTGLFAKKGTDPAIVNKLEKEVRAIMQDPDVKARLRTMVTDAVGSSAEEFGSTIKRELAQWAEIAKSSNVEIK